VQHSTTIVPRVITAEVDKLHANIDLHGRPIGVGTRVRSFSYPFLLRDGSILGFDLEGERADYIEGVVEAIGLVVLDGCPRYTIRPDRRIEGGEGRALTRYETAFHPPVNGTPHSMRGWPTFGVVAVEA